LSQAKFEWQKLTEHDFSLIVISNELGMGIHAENEASRKFADLQGWMISGIPFQIKPL